jgi:hypothetical protein
MNDDEILDSSQDTETTGVVINDALIKQAAALAISGMSQNKVALTLNISRRQARKIYDDERFKSVVEDVGNDAILTAKTRLRQEISKMSDLMLKALRANLEKHSLEAVKVGLKVVGLDEPEKEGQGDGNITVIMANSKEPDKVIEVKPKKLGDMN